MILHHSMKTQQQKDLEKEDVKKLIVFKLPFCPCLGQQQIIIQAFKESGLIELKKECNFIVEQCLICNIRDWVCEFPLI